MSNSTGGGARADYVDVGKASQRPATVTAVAEPLPTRRFEPRPRTIPCFSAQVSLNSHRIEPSPGPGMASTGVRRFFILPGGVTRKDVGKECHHLNSAPAALSAPRLRRSRMRRPSRTRAATCLPAMCESRSRSRSTPGGIAGIAPARGQGVRERAWGGTRGLNTCFSRMFRDLAGGLPAWGVERERFGSSAIDHRGAVRGALDGGGIAGVRC